MGSGSRKLETASGLRSVAMAGVLVLLTSTSNLCLSTFNLQASLDRYVSDPAATARAVAADQTLSSLHSALRRDGAAWILARAATFALDVAGASLQLQPHDVPPIVEWGCEQVRKRLPSDAEREWHVAAMAVFEGLGNLQAVEAHLAHVATRFPDRPEWRHARVWLADSRTLNVHPRQPLNAARISFPSSLAAQYQALTALPEFADDAWIRIGFLHLLSGNGRDAAAAFARAESAAGGHDGTLYLAHLFSAWMFERDSRHDDAIRELTESLDAAPYGRTAAVWLAVRYQIDGRASDAQALATRSLEPVGDRLDPWRTFYGGDIRRWPELIAAARKAVR